MVPVYITGQKVLFDSQIIVTRELNDGNIEAESGERQAVNVNICL